MPRIKLLNKLVIRGILALLSGMLTLSIIPPASVEALTSGSGFLIYAELAQNTPRWRQFKALNNAFTGELSLGAASDVPRQVIIKTSPVREEAIAGTVDDSGLLTIYRFNGYTWSTEWTRSVSGGPGSQTRFDIAYEQSSGEAVVVNSRNVSATNELGYRVWDGTSWTSETTLDATRTGGTMSGMNLVSRRGTDDLALAWIDSQADASARWWNGSTNSFQAEPAAALSTNISIQGGAGTPNMKSLLPIFEDSSGDLLIVWADEAVADLKYITRSAGSGGSWGSVTTETAFTVEPVDLDLASEYNTNYIVYAAVENGASSLEAAIWNGSAWVSRSVLDTSIDTSGAGTNNVSTEWLSAGLQSKAVVTYDDSNASGVDWATFAKSSSTWTVETDYTGTPAPDNVNDKMHASTRNPFSRGEMILLVDDSSEDLFAKKAVMSQFTGAITWSSLEGGSALETDLAHANGTYIADFAYANYVNTPGLSVGIVTGGDNNVPSPSVIFGSKASSGSCQTSTGSLGTNDERIRVINTTSTPGWGLSIAATGGSTATWSSGTAQYDYNDPNGSGCTDSIDIDSYSGQLSVDPSGSTLSADQTCTTSNVSKGSSSAFVQTGTPVTSITLLTASSSADVDCRWQLVNVALSQTIPSLTPPGSYNLDMTLTAVAS